MNDHHLFSDKNERNDEATVKVQQTSGNKYAIKTKVNVRKRNRS